LRLRVGVENGDETGVDGRTGNMTADVVFVLDSGGGSDGMVSRNSKEGRRKPS
jgi:hypothetical protein